QKMRAVLAITGRSFEQMPLHFGCLPCDHAVVKILVVSEIKTEFLQSGLQAPIGFGEKQKPWIGRSDCENGVCPKLGSWRNRSGWKLHPRFLEDVIQHQHRHVTTDPVATAGG